MAMDANERRLLEETIEGMGALTFLLGATLQILNKEVTNLKPRLRSMLGAASASALAPIVAGDAARMIKLATDFVDTI